MWDGYGVIPSLKVCETRALVRFFLLFQPFTENFPHADIYRLIAPDILHQVVKGVYKDHLVTWINSYIYIKFPAARAKEIVDDIDRRVACVPPFANLRRFPQGRGFKQWTGDDTKALMKVRTIAIYCLN